MIIIVRAGRGRAHAAEPVHYLRTVQHTTGEHTKGGGGDEALRVERDMCGREVDREGRTQGAGGGDGDGGKKGELKGTEQWGIEG